MKPKMKTKTRTMMLFVEHVFKPCSLIQYLLAYLSMSSRPGPQHRSVGLDWCIHVVVKRMMAPGRRDSERFGFH